MDWTFGADPEFFLTLEGVATSAHMLLPGSKDKPFPLDNGAVQVDGTAVEFNIHPVKDRHEFKNNIITVLKQIRAMVGEEFHFNFSPLVTYTPLYFSTLPPDVTELGCRPDFNPYTKEQNTIAAYYQNSPVRSAAGHFHTGWTQGMNEFDMKHFDQCAKAARYQHAVFRPGSLFWQHTDDEKRKNIYGSNGAFRPTSYGFEYRGMSNQWIRYEETIDWVFDAGKAAMECLNEGIDLECYLSPLDVITRNNETSRGAINSMFVAYGLPPIPRTLTEIDYGRGSN